MSKSKVFEGIDWGNGSDRGYFVVSIGPDPTPETVQAFRDAYDLGCAWAEAEAALPEDTFLWGVIRQDGADPFYQAEAWHSYDGDGAGDFAASGPTPAAALRALAAKLREREG